MSTCKSCQAPIIWAVTEKGNLIPLDAKPAELPRGLFRLGGYIGSGNRVAYSAAEEPVYQSHFASCPNADEHRKART